jgi:ABC-type multidrug transport system permease subunit
VVYSSVSPVTIPHHRIGAASLVSSFSCINMLAVALTPVTLTFPLERPVFLKEESAKLYSVTPYFISRNLIEIPYSVIFPLITALILYWFVGLSSTAGQFFTFYFITFLMGFSGSSLGLLLGSMITDAKSVSGVVPIIILPLVLFSGYFKNFADLPKWIGWIEYISPLKYGFTAYTLNETMYA